MAFWVQTSNAQGLRIISPVTVNSTAAHAAVNDSGFWSTTINTKLLWVESLDQSLLCYCPRTSVEVRPVLMGIDGDVNGGAVPSHICKGLLTCFLDFAGSLDDGLHELHVGAAQLSLGGDQAGQQLTVLGLVDV